jgi:hypothetical protein
MELELQILQVFYQIYYQEQLTITGLMLLILLELATASHIHLQQHRLIHR